MLRLLTSAASCISLSSNLMAALPRPLRASRSSEGDTVQLALGCLASPASPSAPPAMRLTQSDRQ